MKKSAAAGTVELSFRCRRNEVEFRRRKDGCESVGKSRAGVWFHVLINSRVITSKLILRSLFSFNEANYDGHKRKSSIVVYTYSRAEHTSLVAPHTQYFLIAPTSVIVNFFVPCYLITVCLILILCLR